MKRGFFFFFSLALLFHPSVVMGGGFSCVAADDISGYCQINVAERRHEDFYSLFFVFFSTLSGDCGDLF